MRLRSLRYRARAPHGRAQPDFRYIGLSAEFFMNFILFSVLALAVAVLVIRADYTEKVRNRRRRFLNKLEVALGFDTTAKQLRTDEQRQMQSAGD